MADEDNGRDDRTWPEEFRRFLRRLDPSRSLPGQAPGPRLGPGPVRPDEAVEAREPDPDIIEDVEAVHVTVEVPGVSREDIDLQVTEMTLVVTANTPERKVYQEIPLPDPVLDRPVRATYRNGVLDVTLERRVGAPRDPGR